MADPKRLSEERLAEIRRNEAMAEQMDMGDPVRQELIAELDATRERLRAADGVVDLVRRAACCDGDDARLTEEAKRLLDAYDKIMRGE